MKKSKKSGRVPRRPGISRQDGSGRLASENRGPAYPPDPSASEDLELLLGQAERRMLRIFRDDTGIEWKACSGYTVGRSTPASGLPGFRSLWKPPSHVAMIAHNGLGRILYLRSLLKRSDEHMARLALTGLRIGLDWMRAWMLPCAIQGAKTLHIKPDHEKLRVLAHLGNARALAELKTQDADVDKKRARILAFQEAKLKHPEWRDSENAAIASRKLYGTPKSWSIILKTCRKFDNKHRGGRRLLGSWNIKS